MTENKQDNFAATLADAMPDLEATARVEAFVNDTQASALVVLPATATYADVRAALVVRAQELRESSANARARAAERAATLEMDGDVLTNAEAEDLAEESADWADVADDEAADALAVETYVERVLPADSRDLARRWGGRLSLAAGALRRAERYLATPLR